MSHRRGCWDFYLFKRQIHSKEWRTIIVAQNPRRCRVRHCDSIGLFGSSSWGRIRFICKKVKNFFLDRRHKMARKTEHDKSKKKIPRRHYNRITMFSKKVQIFPRILRKKNPQVSKKVMRIKFFKIWISYVTVRSKYSQKVTLKMGSFENSVSSKLNFFAFFPQTHQKYLLQKKARQNIFCALYDWVPRLAQSKSAKKNRGISGLHHHPAIISAHRLVPLRKARSAPLLALRAAALALIRGSLAAAPREGPSGASV